jgi:hypothetical protein
MVECVLSVRILLVSIPAGEKLSVAVISISTSTRKLTAAWKPKRHGFCSFESKFDGRKCSRLMAPGKIFPPSRYQTPGEQHGKRRDQ